MTILTSDQYAALEGAVCPFCQAEDLSGDSIEIIGGEAVQDITCHDCHRSWTDMYKLYGYEEHEEVSE